MKNLQNLKFPFYLEIQNESGFNFCEIIEGAKTTSKGTFLYYYKKRKGMTKGYDNMKVGRKFCKVDDAGYVVVYERIKKSKNSRDLFKEVGKFKPNRIEQTSTWVKWYRKEYIHLDILQKPNVIIQDIKEGIPTGLEYFKPSDKQMEISKDAGNDFFDICMNNKQVPF